MRRKHSMRSAQSGFSLIELLVVLVILGLLAGLVLPNVLGKLGGAKRQTANSSIVVLQGGIEAFALETGRLPERLEELVERPSDVAFWNGPYVRKNILKDPWNNDWVYRRPGQNGQPFDLITYAEDGAPGGEGNSADISSWD